jgi:AcrR family transcriptional regulator
VVLDVMDRLEEFVAERLRRRQGTFERLHEIAEGQMLFFSAHRDYFRVFAALLTSEAPLIHRRLVSPLLEKRRRLESLLEELVEHGKEDGEIRADLDTAVIVHSFIGMVNQAVARQCGDRGTPAAEAQRTADGVMSILLTGVRRK